MSPERNKADTDVPADFFCFRSLLMGSADRAGGLASTALDAEVRIDDMLSVDLGDSSDGASGCASTAVYAIITDNIRHSDILLIIDWLKL